MLSCLYAFAIVADSPAVPPSINLYIDERERYERHTNPTFSSPAGKNRSDLYSRLRLGAMYTYNSNFSARVEYQNAHDLFWTQNGNASTESSNLSLAYAKYTGSNLTVVGGRQKIDLGEQRLIGSAEWLNYARSFDAGRFEDGQWDAWAGKLGVANSKPEAAQIGVLTHTDKTWGTTSFIAKHDLGAAANIDIQTLDHFGSYTVSGVKLSGEAALQTGSNNGKDQRAWAWHIRAAREVLPKTTLSVEGNAASGGSTADSNRTFDNLYPSNHDQYGLADMMGWKNMNEFAIRLDNRLTKQVSLRASVEAFSLRDPSDAWYAATGGANPRPGGTFIDKTGESGRDIGQELDFAASYDVKKLGMFYGGIAFFDPGHFIQNVSGQSNMMTFGFIQYQLKF